MKGINVKHQYAWCMFLDGVHKIYPLNHVEVKEDDLEHIDLLVGDVRLAKFDDGYSYSAKIMACSDDKEKLLKMKNEYGKCVKRNKRRTSLPSDDYFDDDESPDFLPADQDSTDDEDSSFELDKFIRQRKLSKTKPKQKALVRSMKPKKGVLADVTNLEESEPITDPKTQLKQKPRTNNPKKKEFLQM